MNTEKLMENLFDKNVNSRERACFEAGIKLGAIFHSLLSFPVQNKREVLERIENGFIESFKSQPYVKNLLIHINVDENRSYEKKNEFDYTIIKDFMIEVRLILTYRNINIVARIEWIPEIQYPAMYIQKIS